jgi:hypothetical protein
MDLVEFGRPIIHLLAMFGAGDMMTEKMRLNWKLM